VIAVVFDAPRPAPSRAEISRGLLGGCEPDEVVGEERLGHPSVQLAHQNREAFS
jgi:hypothetical protein